jgi:hypothetical protein
MKSSHCDNCGHLVFFENTQCMKCKRLLAFLPDLGCVGSLEPAEDGLYHSARRESSAPDYRLCKNFADDQVCNWAVPAADTHRFCESCRLTRMIPDLTVPGNRDAWYRLEIAKRRLVYTLKNLQLPVENRADRPDGGLAFDLLSDDALAGAHVLTGHLQGVITISVAEADDAERERRRRDLHEPYRTLLGHFRHEIGHYYWDRLIRDDPRLDAFREMFGDERQDYARAVQAHYASGPPADWPERFVTAYASTHPWEDWAETWAHYLHVTDTLETASACGISITPPRKDEPALGRVPDDAGSPFASFDELMASWFPLTYILNSLNRSLGLPDGYPFVLSSPALQKLKFVHDIVRAAAMSRRDESSATPPAAAVLPNTDGSEPSSESVSPSS